MSDTESKLQREVQELKTEVRRLKLMVEAAVVIVGLAVVLIFPQLLMLGIVILALVSFAVLVSPVRRLILSSMLPKRDRRE